jgi:hypothetical protein
MIGFPYILRTAVLLTVLSALLSVAVAIASGVIANSHAEQLISTFTDAFKVGLAAILGLIGGRASSSDR